MCKSKEISSRFWNLPQKSDEEVNREQIFIDDIYAFMPDEICEILKHLGATNIRISGPGALSRSIPGEVLRNIMKDEALKKDFLDFCYVYDSNIYVAGMGKDNLVVIADLY